MSGRSGVFLDRDGTLIEDAHYLADPARVRLVPGAAPAVRRLNNANVLAIVITNQSGIARGRLTEEDYSAVQARVDALFAAAGAHLDATYHCPHHPDFTGPCGCRKPGTLLHRRALSDWGLEPGQTTCVGDRWHDVAPAMSLGGRGILVPSPETPREEIERAERDAVIVASLRDAVDIVLGARAAS